MSFIEGIPELEGGLGDILNLLGLAHDQSISDEITRLYKEADSLAVFVVKVTVALFWWCSHMASATNDAWGYAEQIRQEMATVNKYELDTWTEFLKVKHPAEIRRVYIRTTKRIQVVKKIIEKQHAANLGPIKKELAALEKWKKVTVTPELRKLMLFWAAWEKTYKHPVVTWVKWFKSPKLFAQWAAMPLVAQLPATLGDKHAQKAAASIAAALVTTWRHDPDTIYNAMLDWLVTA